MTDPFEGLPFWFGDASWCPATDEGTQSERPTTERCLHCDEGFGPDDCGYWRSFYGDAGPRLAAIHRECDFRSIMGGAECMKRERAGTHTVGDHEPDPPGLSKRAAATAAWDYWHEWHGTRP